MRPSCRRPWTADENDAGGTPNRLRSSSRATRPADRPALIDALLAGKDVLIEKPMALTLQDCERMIESVNRYVGKNCPDSERCRAATRDATATIDLTNNNLIISAVDFADGQTAHEYVIEGPRIMR